ncbi:PREDICTED: uncharacterized protein LOC108365514 [Rhagoletis zephyria]|uniref:uncharacterized protein LOC108365514 n=1 Tax=Rhagoletis zephyria TaxID=28612 RepID=UPI0008113230|nr:PREDICTED: uncharacterized protein LOC108365514 [Rhagoletis zephyria]
MKFWCFVFVTCCAVSLVASQTCSDSSVDFICRTDLNVGICLETNAQSAGEILINCATDLTCNTQNPMNGCVSTASASTAISTTSTRGTCVDNLLKKAKSNCRNYYKCLKGAIRTYTCPTGTCFSDDRKACMIGSCDSSGDCTRT